MKSLKFKFQHFQEKTNRPTDEQINQTTDQQTDRRGYRKVILPKKGTTREHFRIGSAYHKCVKMADKMADMEKRDRSYIHTYMELPKHK